MNTQHPLEQWIDKQVLTQKLHVSNRMLQNLRSKNIITYTTLGGKIFYHLPSILALLEKNSNIIKENRKKAGHK